MIQPRSQFNFAAPLLTIIVLVVGCSVNPHPTDQMLEQRLNSNQADFDKLVGMFNEDRDIVRLDYNYVFLSEDSNRNIPKERLDAYRHLFKKLELEGGFHRDGNNVIRLIASTGGMFTANSEKSYVYSRNELSPLVDSLDRVIKNDRGDQSPIYKKLHSNWYLYYESW